MILTPGDIDVGWRTVWMEARGETYEGAKAVVHVLRNRVNHRAGDRWSTIAQVCLDWLQFSGWREADPNFSKALALTLNDSAARRALRAFLEALDERDPTLGARHYYAASMAQPPKWAAGKKPCVVVGGHLFFNDVA